MGTEYLTEAAVFRCPFGMLYRAREAGNQKAKYKGKKLLTTAAILSPKMSPMPCPLLPSPTGPLPCPCAVSPLCDSIVHRAGSPLLTMSAKAMCSLGQPVVPAKSGADSHVLYGEAQAAFLPPIAWPAEEKRAAKEPAKEERGAKERKAVAAASPLRQEKPAAERKRAPQREDVPVFRAGMLCSYSPKNAACIACTYRLDHAEATVDNNSMILRKNYNAAKPHEDPYDCYFDEEVVPLGESKEHKWRYAAHHLISGNQVFKQNSELVRLARFCGYDINAYANCIMLVGYPEDYPDAAHMKSVKAYDVMSESRVQWHVGGHSYTFDCEEKEKICKQIGIRNKLKLSPPDIKTYAELVQAEMEKLLHALTAKKNRRAICYAKQQEKQKFCSKLNSVAAGIKKKLAAFTQAGKPHHSFPYFVSKEAYRYTYGLPRTAKVITVHKEKAQLSLKRYRLEHFTEAIAQQRNNLVINLKGAIALNLSKDGWQRDCILFCENVAYFVYLEDTPRTILPFAVEQAHQFPMEVQATGRDGMKFLQQQDTEILVWLRDHPVPAYTAPVQMVRRRGREAGLDW